MAEHLGVVDPGDLEQLRQLNKVTVVGGDAAGPWLGEIASLQKRRAFLAVIVESNQAELAQVDEQLARLEALAEEEGWT